MKIRITIELPTDNEIQFFDACKGAALKLTELGDKALKDGDHRQFAGTHHDIEAENDDAVVVGLISIGR